MLVMKVAASPSQKMPKPESRVVRQLRLIMDGPDQLRARAVK
jgi:hypothetical protein